MPRHSRKKRYDLKRHRRQDPRTVPSPKPPTWTLQFFARIRSADFSCPHCGVVYRLFSRSPYWDYRTSRFKCRDCGRIYYLGMLAWTALGGTRGVPVDIIHPVHMAPTNAQEAAKLSYVVGSTPPRRGRDPVNRVVRAHASRGGTSSEEKRGAPAEDGPLQEPPGTAATQVSVRGSEVIRRLVSRGFAQEHPLKQDEEDPKEDPEGSQT